jgi:hypothetical protein
MTAFDRSFDRLACVEPSFHVTRPGFGSLDLDGHAVECALDSDDWVRLRAQIDGSEPDLIQRQSRVPLPVKILTGPALMAEMPLTDSLASTFLVLRSAMHRGLAVLASRASESVHEEPADSDVTERLESLVNGSAFTWERAADHIVTHDRRATIVGRAYGTSVVFGTSVVHLGSCGSRSLEALTHFALAANARLRFVRTTITGGRLVHEVALPAAVLTAPLVNHAVASVSAALHLTKRACAALANINIAEQYLEFHTHGKDNHADTHS